MKKTILILATIFGTISGKAQTVKADTCKVAEGHVVADGLRTDSPVAKNNTVSIMFLNKMPKKMQKVNFKTKRYDPDKEKFKNLNLADGVRQAIKR